MKPTVEMPFQWHSPAYPNPDGALCRLRRYDDTPMGTVVLLTEVWFNPGCSVTNGAGDLLKEVQLMLGLDLESTFFIEHYDALSYEHGRETPDFSRVRLDEKGEPVWSHLPDSFIRQLIGEEIFQEHAERLEALRVARAAQAGV